MLLLKPRFRRWCHLMKHILTFSLPPHCAWTEIERRHINMLACSCGKVFYLSEEKKAKIIKTGFYKDRYVGASVFVTKAVDKVKEL